MNRRDVIKMGAVLGLAASFPFFNSKTVQAAFPKLPVPPVLEPDARGIITLALQAGKSYWRGEKATTTWGVNGALLGPALRLQRGKDIRLLVRNHLPMETALHWHGMEVPGYADGGPQAVIDPRGEWQAKFRVEQPAATCWFHPHTHGKTGLHVAMGLGGLILVEDDASSSLPLPNTWGIDDIPVILQDKKLNPKNQIDYQIDVMTAAIGWFGDMMLTNGALHPQHVSPRGWLRLRFLNACNARSLKLAVSDHRPMYVIASDGGFLSEPVKVQDLPIYMGERFEVLIDTSDGKPFDIVTLPVRQMGMTVPPFDLQIPVLHIQPSSVKTTGQLPDALAELPPIPSVENLPSRLLKLTMDPMLDMQGMQALMQRYGMKAMAGMSMGNNESMNGQAGSMNMDHNSSMNGMIMPGSMPEAGKNEWPFELHTANRINGQAFAINVPMFDVKLGQYERWIISSENDMMLHPFHIHGAQFRILSENGKSAAAYRSGWKDIVLVEKSRSEVLVRFAHQAPKERAYMAHCHILEHEDTGMMLSFTVTK